MFQGNMTWKAEMPNPDVGWTAFFIEVTHCPLRATTFSNLYLEINRMLV